MPDILVRNVDADLKRRLAEQARQHNHSLSDEVKSLLRRGLTNNSDDDERKGVGTMLRELIPPEHWTDLAFPPRHETTREPPDFS